MSKLDELMALAVDFARWRDDDAKSALQDALKAVVESRDQLLAAASQARFALSELTPIDPDAGMTIKMLTAAIDAARKP